MNLDEDYYNTALILVRTGFDDIRIGLTLMYGEKFADECIYETRQFIKRIMKDKVKGRLNGLEKSNRFNHRRIGVVRSGFY